MFDNLTKMLAQMRQKGNKQRQGELNSMVVIRLARAGKKNSPFFHVVAANKRGPRDGKYLERLGTYNPAQKDNSKKAKLDITAINAWIKKGAKPSELVAKLIKTTNGK